MNNETSYFLFQITSFKKYFYVSLGNNFFTVFVEAPLVVEALANCSVCPPLTTIGVTSFSKSSSCSWQTDRPWRSHVYARNHLDGGVHIGATWLIRWNDPRAAAMRPYIKLLRPFVSRLLLTAVDSIDCNPFTPPSRRRHETLSANCAR